MLPTSRAIARNHSTSSLPAHRDSFSIKLLCRRSLPALRDDFIGLLAIAHVTPEPHLEDGAGVVNGYLLTFTRPLFNSRFSLFFCFPLRGDPLESSSPTCFRLFVFPGMIHDLPSPPSTFPWPDHASGDIARPGLWLGRWRRRFKLLKQSLQLLPYFKRAFHAKNLSLDPRGDLHPVAVSVLPCRGRRSCWPPSRSSFASGRSACHPIPPAGASRPDR